MSGVEDKADLPVERLDFSVWHKAAVGGWAEHVCSARVFQTSTCSAIAKASSTSIPRYLTVLSILVWPSKSWTALRLPVRRRSRLPSCVGANVFRIVLGPIQCCQSTRKQGARIAALSCCRRGHDGL